MLLNTLTKAAALVAVCFIVSPVMGQTAQKSLTGATTMLSADGKLVGNVSTTRAGIVNNAKVSLVSQGKVIDSVKTDANGSFSFANVNPGPYQIVGSANGMVGAQALHVGPYTEATNAAPASVILQTSNQEAVYDAYASAPVSSFSSAPVANYGSGCTSCSGGGLGGGYVAGGGGGMFGGGLGGGGLGSRLGGGLLASPKGLLLLGGLAGGLAAIDGDDASPDR